MSDKELADIDAELARRGVAPQNEDLAQIDAEIARRKGTRNPGTAGIVNFAAGLAGLPVDTVTGAMNLGIAGYGAAKGALTGDPGASPEPIRAPFGGSESIKSGLRATGVGLLNPDNPTPDSKSGTAAYDFASKGGFIPGGALSAAGSMAAEKLGGPQWAGVGAMLPSAGIQTYNELRAPALAKAQERNALSDKTLNDAKKIGLVSPPSISNPTAAGNALEGFGGKAAVKQQANLINSEAVQDAVRKEIGLPQNKPITMDAIKEQRAELATPYLELSKVSPRAKSMWELYQDAREQATQFWNEHSRQATRSSLISAKNMDAKADMYESALSKEANRVGQPQLVQQMKDARTALAKTYDVERALNLGDGSIDMSVLGRMYDKGAPLSGDLETIAKFALSRVGKQVSRAPENVPSPGVSALNHIGPSALAGYGIYAHDPALLAAAAAYPVARAGARKLLLSDWYQQNYGSPSYTPGMQPELPAQLAARLAVMENQK